MYKVIIILSVLLLISSCNTPGNNTKEQALPGELVWSDEFDYSGVPDSAKWTFDTEGNAWDWGNNEAQNYTPEEMGNAWVENGSLIIEARKKNWTYPGDGEQKNYTSARLITKNKADFTYGRFDIRAKIPTGNGAWPAIWLLATDNVYGGWPDSGEIDIMEYVYNEGNRTWGTVWTKSTESQSGNGSTYAIQDPGADYHVFSIEWDETEIRHYVDGNKFHTYKKTGNWQQWPFDKDMHILLNIAVGGDWNPQINDSIFPSQMLVDYVRVYDLERSLVDE